MSAVLTIALFVAFCALIAAPPLGALALAFILLGVLLFDDDAGTSL
jgi:hypothetical protein